MNTDKINEALAHLKNAELQATQSFSLARTKLKEAIGDQNADGRVDVQDAALLVQKKIGGWTLRDSKVLGAGLVIGAIGIKALPFIVKFL